MLEICVDSALSAATAAGSGAHRIELCDNLNQGGTTPSHGKITYIRKNTDILMNVLVRPRAGDFFYTKDEFEIMKKDIEFCRQAGADGVVCGILRADGSIDTERTAELVELARPMSFTFHRAFDMCSDPFACLEDVILTGADRLLTSGGMNTAIEGAGLIARMVNRAGNSIIIMPGSGINDTNVESLARITGAREFHLSASKITESRMSYRPKGISMGRSMDSDEFSWRIADGEKIRNIIQLLSEL